MDIQDLRNRSQEGNELERIFEKAMLTINLLWFVYGFFMFAVFRINFL